MASLQNKTLVLLYCWFVLKYLIRDAIIYGWYVTEGKCALVTLHVSVCQLVVDCRVVPGLREGPAFFCPNSSHHSRHGWRNRLWSGWEQQLPRGTGGLEESFNKASDSRITMPGQSTSNSFRGTRVDIEALPHTWPKCAVLPKWAAQTPSHTGQSSVYHLRSLMLPVIEKGFLAGSL